jgi:hypothetical protein
MILIDVRKVGLDNTNYRMNARQIRHIALDNIIDKSENMFILRIDF